MDIVTSVYAHAVALSAVAVVIVQQILKLNIVPLSFANRYPVPTLIVLSLGAAIFSVVRTALAPSNWLDWVILVATIAVTAGLTYGVTFKNWAQLRELEGEGK